MMNCKYSKSGLVNEVKCGTEINTSIQQNPMREG